ncbi:hypothetical protein H5201_21100 [Pseudoalteromonas sp. SG43-6]|uniref:lipopolysaccharide biosynthesis protein n=1 Tax=Pseudoalteromonas sp. SG43-6 TaxID=2760967 RepID=UPI0016019382|nr:hypothetical protein [Pseudoalteromonas sp. SG43-6]MBB1436753.1 hypothetical protein [Pseudoalteromonas sp. SG43-6]
MNSIAVISNGILNKFASVLLTLVIIQYYTPSEYAQFSSAYTIIAVFAGLFLMAIVNSVINSRVKFDRDVFYVFYNTIERYMLICVFFIVVLICLLSNFIESVYKLKGLSNLILVISPLLLSLYFETLLQSLMIAEARYKTLVKINVIKLLFALTLMFILIFNEIGMMYFVFFIVLSFLLFNVSIYYSFVDRKVHHEINYNELTELKSGFYNSLKNLSLASLSVIIVNWLLQVTVSRSEVIEDLALFNLIFVFYSILVMLPTNAAQTMYKVIVNEGAKLALRKSMKFSFFFGLVYMLSGTFLIENNFFNLFPRYQFEENMVFLYYILFSSVIVTLKQYFLKLLVFSNNTKLSMYSNFLWAIVNIVGVINYSNLNFLGFIYFLGHVLSLFLVVPYLVKFYREN